MLLSFQQPPKQSNFKDAFYGSCSVCSYDLKIHVMKTCTNLWNYCNGNHVIHVMNHVPSKSFCPFSKPDSWFLPHWFSLSILPVQQWTRPASSWPSSDSAWSCEGCYELLRSRRARMCWHKVDKSLPLDSYDLQNATADKENLWSTQTCSNSLCSTHSGKHDKPSHKQLLHWYWQSQLIVAVWNLSIHLTILSLQKRCSQDPTSPRQRGFHAEDPMGIKKTQPFLSLSCGELDKSPTSMWPSPSPSRSPSMWPSPSSSPSLSYLTPWSKLLSTRLAMSKNDLENLFPLRNQFDHLRTPQNYDLNASGSLNKMTCFFGVVPKALEDYWGWAL